MKPIVERPIIVEVDPGPVGVPVAIDIIPPRPADRDRRSLIVLGEAYQDCNYVRDLRPVIQPWNYLWPCEARELAAALLTAADEAEKVGS